MNTTETEVKINDFKVHLNPIEFSYTEIPHGIVNSIVSTIRIDCVISQIRHENLNKEKKKARLECCSKYSDVFYLESDPLTHTDDIKHSINTGKAPPIIDESYRFPECHKEELEK